MKSFTSWLKKQRDRHDPTGDLAMDAKDDDTWPRHAKKYKEFRDYLWNCGASSECMVAFDRAWDEYGGRITDKELCEIGRCSKERCKDGEECMFPLFPEPRDIERSKMIPTLRFEIMKRDKFRCRICGRDASDGTKLEVDHINPIVNGGASAPSNLWTLCFDCNRGKGTRSVSIL